MTTSDGGGDVSPEQPGDGFDADPFIGAERTTEPPGSGEGAAPGRRVTTTDDGRGFVWDPTPRDVEIDTTGSLGHAVQVAAADGHTYLAEYARDDAGEPRVRYAVSVIEPKAPYEQRPTRGLLDTDAQCRERWYRAVFQPLDPDDPASQLGAPDAPDDDPLHGVGVEAWWHGYFTEAEVEQRLRPDIEARGGSVTYLTRHEPI